jgi:hypothetical protein
MGGPKAIMMLCKPFALAMLPHFERFSGCYRTKSERKDAVYELSIDPAPIVFTLKVAEATERCLA